MNAMTFRHLTALTLAWFLGTAHAACHGPEGPLYAPTDRPPLVGGLFNKPNLEPNAPWYDGVIVDQGFESKVEGAPKLQAALLKSSTSIRYTEPDAQGKPRVCRLESWKLVSERELREKQQLGVREEQKRLLARSPEAIAAWNKSFMQGRWSNSDQKERHLYVATEVANIYYLPDGKVSHIYTFNTESFGGYDLNKYLNAYCFRYDKQGRITNLYTGKSDMGHHCEKAEEQAATYRSIVYAHEIKPHIYYIEDLYSEDGRKSWKRYRGSIGIPGVPRFDATWDSKNGLTKLESYGRFVADYGRQDLPWDKPDRNVYNQGPDAEKFWYFFPKPGPVKLLDDLTQITRYNRVRMSFPEYPANVTEVISSKGEVLARWFLDGGMRQDVMKNGKLWRVLIDDGVKHIGNKHTTWWYEDPEPLKAFAAKHRTQVEKLINRVYEVDENGKWTLLAAEWTRDPPLKPGEQRRSIYVLENGSETVDGKKTWKRGKDMLAAYGFDEAMTLAQKWGRFSPLEEPIKDN